jgi:hypothetical protein
MLKSLKSVKTFQNSFLLFIRHCPSRGGVRTRNGVMIDKMMEFFEKAKDTVKEIINGFNAGSKRLEILNQYILKNTSMSELYTSHQIPLGIIHWRLAVPEVVR